MDTTNFNLGDRLVCVEPAAKLTVGTVYVCRRVYSNAQGQTVAVHADDGFLRWYRADRFSKAEDNNTSVNESTNPKDRVGVYKPSFHYAPASAVILMNQAMRDGAEKYGPYNWRESKVRAEVYYNAAMRHINQWFHGETHARDSKVHHLAHAMACLAILIDAEIEGSLIDNRPPHKVPLDDLIEKLTSN